MKGIITLSFVVTSLVSWSGVEKQISKKEYVEQWRTTAVQQMIQFKIPASITLAQAILESGSGNSELAKKGKNHFGIKCHGWTGETMSIDDDQKNECFRVYASAEESYVDHSDLLKTKKRYANLFNLEITDYKSWAKGLKEAGYATNPKYPELLVNLIEELKLDELDKLGIQNNENVPAIASNTTKVQSQKHQVWQHENKVKYIVAGKGDTYYRISREFGLALWQLYKYNDFGPKKDVLEEGDIVYIQPKRKRSRNAKSIVLQEAMNIYQIAQQQAMTSEAIMKKNDIDSPEKVLSKGEKIILR
jgi:LysM repeat protein